MVGTADQIHQTRAALRLGEDLVLHAASSIADGWRLAMRHPGVPLIIQAYLPGRGGLVLARRLRASDSDRAIWIAARSPARELEGEIRSIPGVEPLDLDAVGPDLAMTILQKSRLVVRSAPAEAGIPHPLWWMEGDTEVIRRFHQEVELHAAVDDSIMIIAEPGCPALELATHVHRQGGRAHGPFLSVRAEQLESEEALHRELMGYVKGAFRGADHSFPGRLEAAHHGTLFLESLHRVPVTIQHSLLRAVESGELYRIGGSEPIRVDVRLIVAWSPSLGARHRVEDEPLYGDWSRRANSLRIPLLRQRLDDLPRLFARKAPELDLGREVMGLLSQHPWPENYVELEAAIQTCEQLAGSDPLPALREVLKAPLDRCATPAVPLAEMERELVKRTLESYEDRKGDTAKILGISRKTLYNHLNEP